MKFYLNRKYKYMVVCAKVRKYMCMYIYICIRIYG